MTEEAIMQLVAVLIGGLVATLGGIVTTMVLEKQKQDRESRNLALAFKGEITALLKHMAERRYQQRFTEIIAQIEASKTPFYAPFKLHFAFDRVYDSNVERIGLLREPLPERLPLFYTRLISMIEDMVNLGEGTYSQLPLDILLRIYRDVLHLVELTAQDGSEILQLIDEKYPPR